MLSIVWQPEIDSAALMSKIFVIAIRFMGPDSYS
tara:strand:+ start:58 stop:159 length:102 start_codon:yes stop_codon:yes gene_type:complete